jgi:acetolactate synthase-1/2/3 large subunit
MTVSEFISIFIEQKNIEHIFQYPGGMITQMIDVIGRKNKTKIYSLLHEQSIAFAVSAMGRLSHKPTIAFATSGPGATNLLTGIGDCYFDSVPALFITGQVNLFELKGDRDIRQLGFQETDIVSMVKPITKWAVQITHADQIVEVLAKAYAISISGRPGPVLIDIPMNIQRAMIQESEEIAHEPIELQQSDTSNSISTVLDMLIQAKSPLIWVGNGVHTADALSLVRQLTNSLGIPVVSSLHAIDVLDFNDPNRVGMIGAYGNRWANKAVAQADCILFLGTRLDIRQTGANLSLFEHKKTIHVDCELGELNNRIPVDLTIQMELREFLSLLIPASKKKQVNRAAWHAEIASLKQAYPIERELMVAEGYINPNVFIQKLSIKNKKPSIYLADVGSHQMWAAQSLQFKKSDRFLTSGGMGAMGFALPASLGAAIKHPDKAVIVITGDASFQMNIQELHSIVKNQLQIKIIVVNNQSMGMIRQFQDTNFHSRYFGTVWDYSCPNFCKVAKAFGIQSRSVSMDSDVEQGIKWLLSGNRSKLLEVIVDGNLNVYPKIAFGQTMDQMEPECVPTKMEST